MAMTTEEELKMLKKQVLVETVQRLSAEMQAARASLALIQMRIPMIEQEMGLAQAKLGELTKGEDDGSSSN